MKLLEIKNAKRDEEVASKAKAGKSDTELKIKHVKLSDLTIGTVPYPTIIIPTWDKVLDPRSGVRVEKYSFLQSLLRKKTADSFDTYSWYPQSIAGKRLMKKLKPSMRNPQDEEYFFFNGDREFKKQHERYNRPFIHRQTTTSGMGPLDWISQFPVLHVFYLDEDGITDQRRLGKGILDDPKLVEAIQEFKKSDVFKKLTSAPIVSKRGEILLRYGSSKKQETNGTVIFKEVHHTLPTLMSLHDTPEKLKGYDKRDEIVDSHIRTREVFYRISGTGKVSREIKALHGSGGNMLYQYDKPITDHLKMYEELGEWLFMRLKNLK